MLREVVAWYSLGEGIKDNILKSLHRGIVHYHIGTGPEEDSHPKRDQAMFFEELRGRIATQWSESENRLLLQDARAFGIPRAYILKTHWQKLGESPTLILVNTQKSSRSAEIDEFNRLNEPNSQKRSPIAHR